MISSDLPEGRYAVIIDEVQELAKKGKKYVAVVDLTLYLDSRTPIYH